MTMIDRGETIEIYCVYNKVNGKKYIGQTKRGYRRRFEEHKHYWTQAPRLREDMEKYGPDSFECELLDVAHGRATANLKERAWIGALKTDRPEYGYNITRGGGVKGEFCEDTIRKMSESRKGEGNSFYGRRHTEEAKASMSRTKKAMYQRGGHPGAKKVKCVETGKVYDCIKDAAEDTGACVHHIGPVADGKYGRKTTGGLHWVWARERP